MIEFENAGFGYGRTVILAGISLTIAPGSFHFLLGPSGAGKTTFVRLCWRDLVPSTGRVRFFGRAIAPRDRDGVADLRRAVGVVHQESRFIDHLSLAENIALPLQVSGIDMRDRSGDLDALLEWVDLAHRVADLPSTLSGSERQRAALARAVVLSPDVILADEPTGNLDRDMGLRLLTLLVELNRMGKAVVIATRDPELARSALSMVQARVLRLVGGRVVPAEGDA